MGHLVCQYQVFMLLFLSWNFHVTLSSVPLSFSPTSAYLCHPDQRLALLQFRNSFFIDNFASFLCDFSYPRTETWKERADCCLWDGVTCDRLTGHVIGLDLSCSWLAGAIHSNNSLFRLSHLQSLNLAFNDLANSTISSSFGQFASLMHLNLSGSNFAGVVPAQMSHLSNLVSLDLSENYYLQFENQKFKAFLLNLTELNNLVLSEANLSSVTPHLFLNMSSSIKFLNLGDCSLQGNLPEDIFHFQNLQKLDIRWNDDLHVSLPQFNWSSPLRILILDQTKTSGTIPSSIGDLKLLNIFSLESAYVKGSIPDSIGNLTKLTSLVLDLNNFTGQIPCSLSNLESLTEFSVANNMLNGSIPNVFHNLSKLVKLDLSENHLSGQIPVSIFNLKELSWFSLWSNQLEGKLPHQISGLSFLTQFDVSDNVFSGDIPLWLFTRPSLAHLDLGNNLFTGQIHEFQSKNLEYISLRNNKIQGLVPNSVFEQVNVSHIDFSSNNLSGTLNLDRFSNLKHLRLLNLSDNNLSLEVNNQVLSGWPKLQTLDLSLCNITSFPQFLRTQDQLRYLSLSNNKIPGPIPAWLWLLANSSETIGHSSIETLDLSHNSLTSITAFPGCCNRLLYLDLRFNLIQGPIPLLVYYPSYFLISNNKLTGEIPASICDATTISTIDLANNNLTGEIPRCLGALEYLSVLNLKMNNLSGSIPQKFSRDCRLRSLDLGGNQLKGLLPRALLNCKGLEILDMGNNKIEDEFPHWLESLPSLQVLVLRSNRFHGPIGNTTSTTPFSMLRIVDLSNNAFTGHLPTRYFESLQAMMDITNDEKAGLRYMEHSFQYSLADDGSVGVRYYHYSVVLTIKGQKTDVERILTTFTTIDFSNNRFKGQISEVVGELKYLRGLNLSYNSLSGHIPISLTNMTALESLDLSFNKLSGNIPQMLKTLTFLSVLNLSYNLLEGPIPEGNQFNTFNNDSYIGNSELCGSPLTKKCGNDESPPPLPSTFQDDDDLPWRFDWKIVIMGYGSGLVIGLSLAYMAFGKGEPMWFTKMVEMLGKVHIKHVRTQKQRHRQQRRRR